MTRIKKAGRPRSSKTALRPTEYAQLMSVLSGLWRADLALSVFMHVREGGERVFATTPTDPSDRVITFKALPDEAKASKAVWAAHYNLTEGVPNVRAQRRLDQVRLLLSEAQRRGQQTARVWISLSNLGKQQVLPGREARPGHAWVLIEPGVALLSLDDGDLHQNITGLVQSANGGGLPVINVRVLKETP